jgi:hypothetical protein
VGQELELELVAANTRIICDFLEWLQGRNIELTRYVMTGQHGARSEDVHKEEVVSFLAEYHGVDLKAVQQEMKQQAEIHYCPACKGTLENHAEGCINLLG